MVACESSALPESRTSIMASLSLLLLSEADVELLLSLLVAVVGAFERISEESTSLLIRGMEAMVIVDISYWV